MTQSLKPYPASRIKAGFAIGSARLLKYYDRSGLKAAFLKTTVWEQIAGRVVIEFNGVRISG